jgi:hypothetical protein
MAMMPNFWPVTRSAFPRHMPPCPAFRWVAAVCAVMVWSLGLLAASPELHARVHRDADHAGHTCAVTLFSQGLDNPVAGAALPLTPNLTVSMVVMPTDPPRVECARDWLRPERGPPVR